MYDNVNSAKYVIFPKAKPISPKYIITVVGPDKKGWFCLILKKKKGVKNNDHLEITDL